ncbi:MAG: hypothetical protein GTO18_12910 [Anaerolineales bacterium]|nr:hypothetical protein [Anaerolineales bacterium]
MHSKFNHTIKEKVALLIFVVLVATFIPFSKGSVSASALMTWSISVNPDNGYPGSTFTVKLKGFTGGFNAAIRWDGVDQVTFTMPDNGQYATTLTVPAGASPGTHTVSACNYCGGGDFEESASTTFEVRRLPVITATLVPMRTSTFTPVPPTHTFTPPPTNTPTSTPTFTPTPTETLETEVPSPTAEPTETEVPIVGEQALPGEVFVDQPVLFVPSCTPNQATFSAVISDPDINPGYVSLLVLPPNDAPMVGIDMEKSESGVYKGTLQLNEDSSPGEWNYSVIVLAESGVTYRSEMAVLIVNACEADAPESLSTDQLLELAPYLAIGFIVIAALSLLVIGAVLAVARVRRR